MNQPEKDDSSPHQIRLTFNAKYMTTVSCTCRRIRRSSSKYAGAYVPFGYPGTTREAKALFNDLTKHDQSAHPFTTEHLLEER